ncbi:hypothetical protein OUZ56_015870 [Daphnia magna]|uniref:Uncharacterized protein n=1 Tax=Daphnia magna TaxID=35525 RepID=A0ABR0ANZ2_9CRUS|nr:hypothetical protein OUZ56_015870 [Daphnia magna]
MVSSEENLELCMVCEKAEESSELGLVLQSDGTQLKTKLFQDFVELSFNYMNRCLSDLAEYPQLRP